MGVGNLLLDAARRAYAELVEGGSTRAEASSSRPCSPSGPVRWVALGGRAGSLR